VDHQIHKNAARLIFIQKPVARWFLWPIAAALLTFALFTLLWPIIRRVRDDRRERTLATSMPV